ncbi:MAG: 3-methyl-2-oxobutanoate hydroxymethyltransferase [Lentisphaerae bacterium]|nr:3-methyl-2-oxobutanoate hydroxymethyltransferase [Lentisphaerota bacterium]
MNKWTVDKIKNAKGREKIVCLTAYDYSTARIIDQAGIHLILVGDSLAMTMLGYETTLPVTMDEMLHHTKAVTRGVKNALVVADMPFMSYQVSVSQAIANAGRFVKEANAGAVKIEGGISRTNTIKALLDQGIPVLGHIGLTPQSINQFGGFKIQGKIPQEAARLMKDASALAEAGVFAVVLECVPADLAADITASCSVPTIGIGAGPGCDGQILVTHDMLGIHSKVSPKFVKRYADLDGAMQTAFENYAADVKNGVFPSLEHSY